MDSKIMMLMNKKKISINPIKNRESYKLNLSFLNLKYDDYLTNYYENLTLFEIMEYGHQEVVHTKFLYWQMRPSYHKFSYKNDFILEFLKLNDIISSENANFFVYLEKTSDNIIQEDESKRRSDLYIDIEENKKIRRVVIENKIFSELTEFQVEQEIIQYLKNPNDVFIALLLDSNVEEFYSIIKKSEKIKEYIQIGIKLKLFPYSEWLNLNKRFIENNKFSRNEKEKVKHLNENIRRLLKMNELKEFDDNFKIYLSSYRTIDYFETAFQEQCRIFLNHLKERILKETNLTNGRMKNLYKGLKFDFDPFDIEIFFTPEEGLNENIGKIAIGISNDIDKREEYLKKIQERDDFNNEGTNYWKWIQFEINPYNIKGCEDIFINKIKNIEKTLLTKKN